MAKSAKTKVAKSRALGGNVQEMIALSVREALDKMKEKKEVKPPTGEGVYRVQVVKAVGFGRISKVVDRRLAVDAIRFEQRSDSNDTIFMLWATGIDDAKDKVRKLCNDNWELVYNRTE